MRYFVPHKNKNGQDRICFPASFLREMEDLPSRKNKCCCNDEIYYKGVFMRSMYCQPYFEELSKKRALPYLIAMYEETDTDDKDIEREYFQVVEKYKKELSSYGGGDEIKA